MKRKLVKSFRDNYKLIIGATILGGIINVICGINEQMDTYSIIFRAVLSIVLIFFSTWIAVATIDSAVEKFSKKSNH